VEAKNDGGQYSGNTPVAGDPTFYTKAQIDGLIADFLKQDNDNGKVLILRNNAGQGRKHWTDDEGNDRSDPV
jgi:hypothetical protein